MLKKISLFLASSLAVMGLAMDFEAQSSSFSAPSAYDWHYRPVFIFADKQSGGILAPQLQLFLTQKDKLAARNMALITVTDEAVIHYGPKLALDAHALRRRYNIAQQGFTLILVGKDTGEKYRARKLLDPQIIFDTIDGMPMRIQEMQSQRDGF